MNKQEARTAIFYEFAKLLEPLGFKGKKSESSFTRKTDYGLQQVGFPLWDYNPVFASSFNIGLRFDAVQDLVNPFSAYVPDFWDKSLTVILGPEYLVGQPLEFELRSVDETKAVMTGIGKIFSEHVFPLLERCQTLGAVERLLNDSEGKNFITRLDDRAISGVAAAALCHRPDYSAIVEKYRRLLSGHIEPVRQRFEALVAHLAANIAAN
jgi:hypothetical protein